MEIRICHEPGLTLAVFFGPLDDDSRPKFNDHLHPLAAVSGTRLVLDLAEVPRITSNGLGALVALVAWANAHDARILLCSPTTHVASVFKATKLDTYFEIAPNADDARQRLAKS